ncbi:palmitoyltransferase for Vac8p [Pleurotus ostreatus]|uniref:Palmitoyltransferase n=2 Tax=Pleurotus ostreatus TaxID=5322 RepID=A0A8H6ZSK7_PLEOS|nr:palmitoyltransferase for Vac8p [Pleurotus ostreatus]KAF7422782.1 palmitoyltransferase for Vac8p [Pleurotus ostreatus]
MPLITLDYQDASTRMLSPVAPQPDHSKTFVHYLPLGATVLLLLAPHPSVIFVVVKYHLLTLEEPLLLFVHLAAIYTLSFLAFSSLIVCVARDPGPVNSVDEAGRGEGDGLMMSTVSDDVDFNGPGKWCRECWAPKPERTHHCSHCGRCVLKMDHHCPWLGARCIGHRTYPAFVHFLTSVTLLATYIAFVNGSALWFAFNNVLAIDEAIYLHELSLFFAGVIFALVIGSFLFYHVYLISTNQTTIENLSPFMLLRHLPPLPASNNAGRILSDPPSEHELTYEQRYIVREAHGAIRLYDIGLRRNWAQVFGWERRWGWVPRLLHGGGSKGDGRSFVRNPRSDDMLATLATELVKAGKDN